MTTYSQTHFSHDAYRLTAALPGLPSFSAWEGATDNALRSSMRALLLAAVSREPDAPEQSHAMTSQVATGPIDAAFADFLTAHQDMILGVAYRLLHNRDDAFDVLQEVALTSYRCWQSLDQDQNIRGWLYRTTVNQCHRWLRQRARHSPNDAPDHTPEQIQAPRQEEHVRSRQFQAFMADALALLSEKEREAFVLRDIEQHPGKELAVLMGCQPATARGYYFSARKKLAAHIKEQAPEWLTLLGRGGAS